MGSEKIVLRPTLARGMDYYTGSIFEMIIPESGLGSIGGGGRYDNLTARFGLKDVSGVGFSFGFERIFDWLVTHDKFPKKIESTTQVLFVPLSREAESFALASGEKCRNRGIFSQVQSSDLSLKNALRYANKKKIPWVVLIGEEEIKEGLISVKNMKNKTQKKIDLEQFFSFF